MATIDDCWVDYVKKGYIRTQNGCKTIYTIPPHMGEGGFEIWGQSDFVMATILDTTLYKPIVVLENVSEKYLQFSQFYSGKAEFYQKRTDIFPIEHGLNFLVHHTGIFGYKRVEEQTRLIDIGMCYRSKFFDTLPFDLPEDFWETAANVLNEDVIKLPAITAICEQIRYCTLNGTALNMFVYGKAYEAFSIILDYIYEHKRKPPVHISASDKELYESIKAILKKQLKNPPSISDLSAMLGINQRKLMAGFKYLNGFTIYNYLKLIRMETAAELLRESNMNILDIACSVGYHGDGHFQQAFKEVYGATPKEFRKNIVY